MSVATRPCPSGRASGRSLAASLALACRHCAGPGCACVAPVASLSAALSPAVLRLPKRSALCASSGLGRPLLWRGLSSSLQGPSGGGAGRVVIGQSLDPPSASASLGAPVPHGAAGLSTPLRRSPARAALYRSGGLCCGASQSRSPSQTSLQADSPNIVYPSHIHHTHHM